MSEDEGDNLDYDDLTPNDVEEADDTDVLEIEAEEVTAEWSEATTPEMRQSVIDHYAEHGDLDGALHALGAEHATRFAEAAAKVETAVNARIGREIAETGLSFDELMEHMAEDDYGYYRQQAIRGNWEPFKELAWKGVALRMRLAEEAGEPT